MRFELIQAEWFRCLVGSLAGAGVRRVIVSPGSRSTPLVCAAHAEPRLDVMAVPDERSAAFVALGQARATSFPTVLVRTSGTASAHDYPAVIEASEDHVPLIVLSADRPFELQGAGAPQTTDQRRMFGGFVRFDAELGLADPEGLDGLARTAVKAVFRSLHPVPGPVHLNARARKPLEPVAPSSPDESGLRGRVDARLARPTLRIPARRRFEPDALTVVVDALRGSSRTGLVVGPLPPGLEGLTGAARRFVLASGALLLPEAAGQLRQRDLSPWDDFEWRRPEALDVAILLGRHPSSRVLQDILRDARRLFVVHPHEPADPEGRAEVAFEGPVVDFLEGVAGALGSTARSIPSPPRSGVGLDAWSRVRGVLDPMALGEAHVARAVAEVLPAGSALCLANSLAIRVFDRFVPAFDRALDVFSQRGVNGIDGQVSGAAGVASVREGATAAVIGDIAFLHDLGGLAFAARIRTPLPIVVIDNGGGMIFRELPLAQSGPEPGAMPLFTTPHRHRLTAAAEVFGLPGVRVEGRDALCDALKSALARPGATVVHAVLAPDGVERATRQLQRGGG